MGTAEVLRRVDADLARGSTYLAIQRLSSLVAADPANVELRLRLALVHRSIGDRVEAGRWSYLHPDADPADTRAFERAYPAPAQRLRRLRWPADAGGSSPYARARLERLRAEARREIEARPAGPVVATPWSYTLIVAVAAVVALVFAVLGAATVVRWLG